MNTNDIDTKIKWVELQLESATCNDAKCDYKYELANLKFKKQLQSLKQKAHNITTEPPSILDLFKKSFPIKF